MSLRVAFKHIFLFLIVGLFASYALEYLLSLEDRLPLTFVQHVGYSLFFAVFPLLIGAILSYSLLFFKKTKKFLLWQFVWGCYVIMFLLLAFFFLWVYLFN
jgi:hypothetical protein